MDIEKIKRKNVKSGPNVNINIKVSTDVSKWLKEKNYSPTGIFQEALKQIGCPHVAGAKPEEPAEATPYIGAEGGLNNATEDVSQDRD